MVRRITPSCCADRRARRARLLLLVLAFAAVVLLPLLARGDELVAEAAFLADTLPPAGRDLSLTMTTSRSAPELAPRMQLALALGDRAGVTADVGLRASGPGPVLDRPSASLKLLLREGGQDRTGLSACLDLVGSADRPGDSELGAGLGLVRGVGPVTLRGAVWAASSPSAFEPHLHVGASAAIAASARLRLLAEVVSDLERGAPAVAAGPTVKVAVDRATSVAGGVLLGATPAAEPAQLYIQLTRSL